VAVWINHALDFGATDALMLVKQMHKNVHGIKLINWIKSTPIQCAIKAQMRCVVSRARDCFLKALRCEGPRPALSGLMGYRNKRLKKVNWL
jgi:hypothetical protein